MELAYILGSRGNKGELATEPYTSRWERLNEEPDVFLVRPDNTATPAKVEQVWPHKDRLVFKLQGIDSISDAEKWKGASICVTKDRRPELPEGEHYLSDLIGCTVVSKPDGETLGVVDGWQECGGPVLLEVERTGGREPLLIPFEPALCVEVDVAGRRIVVDLPEGFLDLYA